MSLFISLSLSVCVCACVCNSVSRCVNDFGSCFLRARAFSDDDDEGRRRGKRKEKFQVTNSLLGFL